MEDKHGKWLAILEGINEWQWAGIAPMLLCVLEK